MIAWFRQHDHMRSSVISQCSWGEDCFEESRRSGMGWGHGMLASFSLQCHANYAFTYTLSEDFWEYTRAICVQLVNGLGRSAVPELSLPTETYNFYCPLKVKSMPFDATESVNSLVSWLVLSQNSIVKLVSLTGIFPVLLAHTNVPSWMRLRSTECCGWFCLPHLSSMSTGLSSSCSTVSDHGLLLPFAASAC